MKTSLILLIYFFIQGCSADIAKEEDSLRVEAFNVSAWYNLMPGGPPSFHVAGELNIKNETEVTIQKLILNKIIVLQQGKKIYEFTPWFDPVTEKDNFLLKAGEEKSFLFSTKSGLDLNTAVDENAFITAVLEFSADNLNIKYFADSLIIEKAY